jgi:hypothetical protein
MVDRNPIQNEVAPGQLVSRMVEILVKKFAAFNCKILGLPSPPKIDPTADNDQCGSHCSNGGFADRMDDWAQVLCTLDYMVRALDGLGVNLTESIVVSESRCLWHAAASAILCTTQLPRRFPTEFRAVPSPQAGLDGMPLSEAEFLTRWQHLQSHLLPLKCPPVEGEEVIAEICEALIGTVSLLCQYRPPALIDASVIYHHSPSTRRSSRYSFPFPQAGGSLDVNEGSQQSVGVSSSQQDGAAQSRPSGPSPATPQPADFVAARGWFDGLFGAFGGGGGPTKQKLSSGPANGSPDAKRRDSWAAGKHSITDGKVGGSDGGPGYPLRTFSQADNLPAVLTGSTTEQSISAKDVSGNRLHHPHSRSGTGSFGRRCGTVASTSAESLAFASSMLHQDLSLLQQDWPMEALDKGCQWLRLCRCLPRRVGTGGDGKAKNVQDTVTDQCGGINAAGPDDECLIEICGIMQTVIRGSGSASTVAASPRLIRVAMWGLACVGPLLCHGGTGDGSSCHAVKEKLAGDIMQTLLWASTSGLAADHLVQSSLIVASTALGAALGTAAAKHAATLSKLVKTGLESPHSSCRLGAYRAIVASIIHLSPSMPHTPEASGRQLHDSVHEPGLIRSLSGLLLQAVGPRLTCREGCWSEAAVAWDMLLQLLMRCPSTREVWSVPAAEAAGRLLASEETPRAVVRTAARCVAVLLMAGAAVTAADTVAARTSPHSTYFAGLTIQATRVCLGWGPSTPGDVVARLCGAGRKETRWMLRLLPPFLVAAVPTRYPYRTEWILIPS